MDSLWSDTHVNEAAVPWTISHARRVLGQRSGEKNPIDTVHGRGYRFIADVEIVREPAPIHKSEPPGNDARVGAPFVGRADVMRQLGSGLLDVKDAGKGGFCLLVGPAGIGKTRCMSEGAAQASASGFSVWTGRSLEDASAPVFWPWVQIVRSVMLERPTLSRRAESLLAELRALEGDASKADDAAQARDGNFWWFDGLSRLLCDAAREQPVLLLLDDVQWADAATLDVLAFLVPDLHRIPLLVLAARRSDCSASRSRALERLSRHAQRVELGPLTEEDVAKYLSLTTRSNALEEAIPIAVHRATAGNPLFVQHTVRMLLSRHGDGPIASLSPDMVQSPAIAADVLTASLGRLEPTSRSCSPSRACSAKHSSSRRSRRCPDAPQRNYSRRSKRLCAKVSSSRRTRML